MGPFVYNLLWAKTDPLTWKMVLSSGFPEPCSRPMSWHQMLTSSTSATASANRALWRSKFVSSSPRSRPSLPSRSITKVAGSAILEDLASQMPYALMFHQTVEAWIRWCIVGAHGGEDAG